MKTVLAPNAPWPTTTKEKLKAVARKRVLPPPNNASKQKNTDAMFEQWASKNKGTINEIH
jgi:hypothetical protein